MRVGQTSFISFVSRNVGSVLGFVATVYFARELGAEVLGVYALVIAVAAWLRLPTDVGFGQAAAKRISEGVDQGAYVLAYAIVSALLFLLVVVPTVLLRRYIEAYVGGFEEFAAVSVVWFVVLVIASEKAFGFVNPVLMGLGRVHISELLRPSNIALQSLVQIVLVYLGFGLVGMVGGYVLGQSLTTVIGLRYLSTEPELPRRRHVRRLLEFAKFSWLGGLKGRAFNDVDILVLGAFVSQALVGIYAVSWSISRFISMFGIAVGNAVFPEISSVSARESNEAAAGYFEVALAYGGLVVIPGLVGGVLLADRLLRIYSPEFVRGTQVLWLLLLSMVFYTYLQQYQNAMNAFDRPDLAFAVNVLFIASNIVLNIVLIWQFGWVGAAAASAASTAIGLVVSAWLFRGVVTIELPAVEIGRQWAAALGMGAVVWGVERTLDGTGLADHNFAVVLALVTLGAGTYVAALLLISPPFRDVVGRNLPPGPTGRV